MKTLNFLFLAILLPFVSFGQLINFDGSKMEYFDLKGQFNKATVNKTGSIEILDSTTIVYVENPSENCFKEYRDTMKVLYSFPATNGGKNYIISPTMYFIIYPEHILFVRKSGVLWLYEKLKRVRA